MIVVTDVKIVKTDDSSTYRVAGMQDRVLAETMWAATDIYPKRIGISIDEIEGETFKDRYGATVVIGWSKAVQKALRLPFYSFNMMRDEINDMHKTIRKMQIVIDREKTWRNATEGRIEEILSWNLWQRFKFLLFWKRVS